MLRMVSPSNMTTSDFPQPLLISSSGSQTSTTKGNEYLYILIVMSFYGVFLFGIMLGYIRTKRREKRKSNAFTRLLHEEEQREWGAMKKKHSLTLPTISGLWDTRVPVPMPMPFSCTLCTMEESSLSSLCSSADMHLTIEEEAEDSCMENREVDDHQEKC